MEDMTDPPDRGWHDCWCLIVHHNYSGKVINQVLCHVRVPPDQPFCRHCEARHPELVDSRLITITTRPLPV